MEPLLVFDTNKNQQQRTDMLERAFEAVSNLTPEKRRQSLREEALATEKCGYKRARKRFGAISSDTAQEEADEAASHIEPLVKEAEAFAEKAKGLGDSADGERAYNNAKQNMLDAWYAAGQADAFVKMAHY